MRAVDDRLDSFGARHFADLLHGRDLTSDIHLMRHENQLRSARDSAFECISDLAQVLWRNRNLHHLQHKTFTTFTLTQRGQHSRIVLRRRENFIAGLEIHSHQANLERLRCIARDRDLFAVATKYLRQASANSFRLRLENLPHRVGSRVFLLPDVTNESFRDDARARRHTAVIQIHDAACDGERILDHWPVIFVHRSLFWCEVSYTSSCSFDFFSERSDRWNRKRGESKTFSSLREELSSLCGAQILSHVISAPLELQQRCYSQHW